MGDPSANIVICYQPSGISAIHSLSFRIMGIEKGWGEEKSFFSEEKFCPFNQETETSFLLKKCHPSWLKQEAKDLPTLKIISIFAHVNLKN